MPVYRKIAFAFASLQYFQQAEFFFNSDNMWRLQAMVHPKDRKDFGLDLTGRSEDWMPVSRDQLLGVAKYALKEKIDSQEDIERNCRHAKLYVYGHQLPFDVLFFYNTTQTM